MKPNFLEEQGVKKDKAPKKSKGAKTNNAKKSKVKGLCIGATSHMKPNDRNMKPTQPHMKPNGHAPIFAALSHFDLYLGGQRAEQSPVHVCSVQVFTLEASPALEPIGKSPEWGNRLT